MSISVRNLVKRFGSLTVVHSISFEVARGEFVSLLGPSGCGKTTTLRCLAGLEHAEGGEISIDDEIVSAPDRNLLVPVHERDIGMVFQSYAIWPHMTVAQNVSFPLTIRKIPATEIARQVDETLKIVGLDKLRDRRPSQLSGGQQQRVALARAIVGRPKVLLFDEPLSNLDAKLRDGTRSEIRRLQRELGIAAIYVTHDQEEALSMSDRVIVMDRGRIQQVGTPKQLYRRPDNRFVADFVGRASFIDIKQGADGSWVTAGGQPVLTTDTPSATGRYQAMLRPEHIEISRAGTISPDRIHGRISESHYLGAHTEYVVEAFGTTIKVHSLKDFETGDDVVLSFSPENCRLIAVGEEARQPDYNSQTAALVIEG